MLYLQLIIFSVGDDVAVDNESLLVTNFVNFRCAYRDRVCVHVFIGVIAHTCMNIYVYIVFSEKKWPVSGEADKIQVHISRSLALLPCLIRVGVNRRCAQSQPALRYNPICIHPCIDIWCTTRQQKEYRTMARSQWFLLFLLSAVTASGASGSSTQQCHDEDQAALLAVNAAPTT
jgi:hypothetical protein